ncbi:hypothetical protein F5878DRAFT_384652 [Lentinula raphanica]|uniref:Uncharacterized protein n=1 Tax=Lentinula raphanica TaxID=153919 RepID=A0AA38P090_9AGAR|nr:hypothetical protein F5878DRAFT_384652 [Lentinula raphanica]
MQCILEIVVGILIIIGVGPTSGMARYPLKFSTRFCCHSHKIKYKINTIFTLYRPRRLPTTTTGSYPVADEGTIYRRCFYIHRRVSIGMNLRLVLSPIPR